MKNLSALVLFVAGAACAALPAFAQNGAPPHHAKKGVTKKAAHAAKHVQDDDPEPDVTGMQATSFDCELGNKLTVYQNFNADQQISLHWKKRLHRLTRVGTTTGAQRFENAQSGLVWIGIPAKSMLLDSKKGQQLANECKSPAQRVPVVAGKG